MRYSFLPYKVHATHFTYLFFILSLIFFRRTVKTVSKTIASQLVNEQKEREKKMANHEAKSILSNVLPIALIARNKLSLSFCTRSRFNYHFIYQRIVQQTLNSQTNIIFRNVSTKGERLYVRN